MNYSTTYPAEEIVKDIGYTGPYYVKETNKKIPDNYFFRSIHTNTYDSDYYIYIENEDGVLFCFSHKIPSIFLITGMAFKKPAIPFSDLKNIVRNPKYVYVVNMRSVRGLTFSIKKFLA